jgi:hypothetical protein
MLNSGKETPMIGPSGKHEIPPINASDKGGIYVGFKVLGTPKRLMAQNFGTTVSWFAIHVTQAQAAATAMRKLIVDAYGMMPYNKATLPLKVILNKEKGVIEVHLPLATDMLVANAEMWLAFAEVIEDRLIELGKSL